MEPAQGEGAPCAGVNRKPDRKRQTSQKITPVGTVTADMTVELIARGIRRASAALAERRREMKILGEHSIGRTRSGRPTTSQPTRQPVMEKCGSCYDDRIVGDFDGRYRFSLVDDA